MIRMKQVKNLTFSTLAALTASTLTTPEFAFITAENSFWTKIAGVNTKIADADVMTLTTAQTVTGVKTFTAQPSGITAASIVNVAAGTIAAVTVQAALNELDTEKQAISAKSAINGYASLDGTGKVPAAELPSYVDDVLEFANLAGFPVTGTTGIIYVDLATNKVYRWSGATYVEISAFSGVATDVSVTPAGNITATNVGAALNQLDTLMVHLAGAETITGVKTFTAQPVGITAASIVNVAAGNIAAVTTQAALNELDTEKQANIQLQEEGTNVGTSGQATTINFVGSGVTTTISGAVAIVTVASAPTERFVDVVITATDTATALAVAPITAANVKFYINGILEKAGIVSNAGGAITITAAVLGYSVETTDIVTANYFSA